MCIDCLVSELSEAAVRVGSACPRAQIALSTVEAALKADAHAPLE